VSVIPHGVPDIAFVPPLLTPGRTSESVNIWKLCSIGFFRPDKGIEEILKALSLLKVRGQHFQYVIAGSPQSQFSQQKQYFHQIKELVSAMNLVDEVRIDARFLSRSEQIQLIQDTHAGVFAYQDPDQSSSGTIPLVMAAGRPVVCTPFEFAMAKQIEFGEGVIVAKDFSATALAEALTDLLGSTPHYLRRALTLHAQTRHWTWQTVGTTYAAAFEHARSSTRGRIPFVSSSPL
jgi:glycosyltransferase involved in cell wall biosynthesis